MRTEGKPAASPAWIAYDQGADGRWPVLVYLGIAAILFGVSAASSLALPDAGCHVIPAFRGCRWLHGWAQWDSGWYASIAQEGYDYVPERQSTIAFFPAYPLAMRAIGTVVGNIYVAGILVTVASAAVAARLFFAWLRERMSGPGAWGALGLLLLYPYAFFLYGAVYPTALFLVTLLAAFVLLEHDRPWLAGLVGAVATAAGPTGVVLVVALAVRAVERRRQLGDRGPGWRDAGVLLSGLGVAGFCLYSWRRFGDPFLFASVQEAWGQQSGPRTWLKARFFEDLTDLADRRPLGALSYLAHPALTLGALALVPHVFRRFGYGYGVYTALVVVLPALGTKNFFGMGRYLLAAFPCFAVAGEFLAERPSLAKVVYPVAAIGLLVLTAAYSQSHYLS